MSRVSSYVETVAGGTYKVLYPFEGKNNDQLTLEEEEILTLQDQQSERGWVWATNNKDQSGFVPFKYVVRIAKGGWDKWAYGSEVVACCTLHFVGLITLMFGTQQLDGDVFMALGALSMFFGSLCMLLIFFRSRISAVWRGCILIFFSIPLLACWPIGFFGGVMVLVASIAEFVKHRADDEEYSPPAWTMENCCGFIFDEKRTCSGYTAFFFWVVINSVVFWLGYRMGEDDRDEWREDDDIILDKPEWAFAQATGTVLSFNFLMILVFSLRGFQSILLGCGDNINPTYKDSCASRCKKYLENTFTEENMAAVHSVISCTIIVATIGHILGNFASYDKSGPGTDYEEHFGSIPFFTGGACFVLMGITISSSFISPERNPRVFKIVNRAAYALVLVLFFHGRDGFNQNFWKFMVAPVVLYCIDRGFRLGVSAEYEIEDEEETAQFKK